MDILKQLQFLKRLASISEKNKPIECFETVDECFEFSVDSLGVNYSFSIDPEAFHFFMDGVEYNEEKWLSLLDSEEQRLILISP